MTNARVVVVGGGLAGLSAALSCADAGARVTLLEARARLGGATHSFRREGLWVDNGQHVFLRCCTAYRAFLDRLGTSAGATLQPRLAIPVLAPGKRPAWIRRTGLPAPLHLAGTLLRYGFLPPRDRLRAAGAALALARLDRTAPEADRRTFLSWLEEAGQTPRAVAALWDLITVPTLNLPAARASLGLAAMVFQTGLLSQAGAADIGYARVPLSALHVDPAARALREAGAEVRLRAPAAAVETDGRAVTGVRTADATLPADAVILAVPHDRAADLLPPGAGVDPDGLRALGTSPIVNVHVVYDRRVTDLPFAAGLDTPVQWVFDRTEPSGLERGQYLAVSVSAADDVVNRRTADLRETFLPALARLFPRAAGARVLGFFVTRERAATFRAEPGTASLRPGPRTGIRGLYLAGAWTDTGWPATMEGAVRSGRRAARQALGGIGRRVREDAAAGVTP